MAYRNPRFCFHHALRDSAVAAWDGDTFAAGFGKEHLRDDLSGVLAKWSGTGTVWQHFDRGADFVTEPDLDRLIIPAGHNLGGLTLTFRQKVTPHVAQGEGTVFHTAGAAAGTGLIDVDSFSVGAATARYIAWQFFSTVSAAEVGELWLTQTRTTTRGPVFSWQDYVEATHVEVELRSGQVQRLEVGAPRRVFVLEYQALSGADLAVFTDMRTETQNGLFPLWIDPPDDSEDPVLVDIVDGIKFVQDHPNPGAGTFSYTCRLTLIEHTG